jgi:DNA-binding response OmpR family regulator
MNPMPTILIVDDEPNVRLVFRTALESAGYAVAEAGDGASAVDRQRAAPAGLILLDLHMPGLGGMEVLRRLRAAGDSTPVVIVTAHGSIPDAVAAMKLGAIDFLAKPLTPEALRAVVADVLDRHAPIEGEGQVRPGRTTLTAAGQFAQDLRDAKRLLNHCEFDRAEASLRRALVVDPQSAEAHNLMGVLHESRNEHDDSYREYRAALKADGRFEPAQHNMRRYYERFTFGRSAVPLDLGGD